MLLISGGQMKYPREQDVTCGPANGVFFRSVLVENLPRRDSEKY